MDEDYEVDLLTLVDDDGVEHEFEIVDEIETDEGHYIALIPYSNENILDDAGTYYIFEVVEEDGEEQLMELEDDETLNRIDAIFQERFNADFFEEEEK